MPRTDDPTAHSIFDFLEAKYPRQADLEPSAPPKVRRMTREVRSTDLTIDGGSRNLLLASLLVLLMTGLATLSLKPDWSSASVDTSRLSALYSEIPPTGTAPTSEIGRQTVPVTAEDESPAWLASTLDAERQAARTDTFDEAIFDEAAAIATLTVAESKKKSADLLPSPTASRVLSADVEAAPAGSESLADVLAEPLPVVPFLTAAELTVPPVAVQAELPDSAESMPASLPAAPQEAPAISRASTAMASTATAMASTATAAAEQAQVAEPQVASQTQEPEVEPRAANPITVAEAVDPPVRLVTPLPSYPPDAWVAGVQGDVLVRARIDEQGTVADVQVLRGLSHGLTEAAVDAVRRWRFRPASIDGRPVATDHDLSIRFTL